MFEHGTLLEKSPSGSALSQFFYWWFMLLPFSPFEKGLLTTRVQHVRLWQHGLNLRLGRVLSIQTMPAEPWAVLISCGPTMAWVGALSRSRWFMLYAGLVYVDMHVKTWMCNYSQWIPDDERNVLEVEHAAVSKAEMGWLRVWIERSEKPDTRRSILPLKAAVRCGSKITS